MHTKNSIKIFVVIAVIAVGIVTYYFQNPSAFRKATVLEQAQREGAQEAALNGTVLRRTDDGVYLKTGYMASTAEGTKFVTQEKKVVIPSISKIYLADEVTETTLSEIFTGAVITIYIPINSVASEEVIANKVIVDRK